MVVGAGGVYTGSSLAAHLGFGADGVWVGTRFICAEEAGASKAHQEAVMSAGPDDTIRTIIYTVSNRDLLSPHVFHAGRPKRPFGVRSSLVHDTDLYALPFFVSQGRPMRVRKTPFIMDWESRQDEIKRLTSKGTIPVGMEDIENRPYLMGVAAQEVHDIKPAKAIVDVS